MPSLGFDPLKIHRAYLFPHLRYNISLKNKFDMLSTRARGVFTLMSIETFRGIGVFIFLYVIVRELMSTRILNYLLWLAIHVLMFNSLKR